MSKTSSKKTDAQRSKTVRQSVSFKRDVHETLELLAQEKKVSVAWVVRDAVEKYISDRWPLLNNPNENGKA
jgi:metal-responsive CopG/Arc/MetJ family transcriptional regulator